MLLRLKRTPGIYLVGFMGSGKTEVGRLLADELGWSFVDLDEDIETSEGASIAEIFDTRGEAAFRKLEHEALDKRVRDVERGQPMVMATGGGVFADETNRKRLEERGVTIWLDCPLSRICGRLQGTDNRPLARDPERFKQLYEGRREAYVKADYSVDADTDDAASVVAAILKLGIF